jgi:hypothetical protein
MSRRSKWVEFRVHWPKEREHVIQVIDYKGFKIKVIKNDTHEDDIFYDVRVTGFSFGNCYAKHISDTIKWAKQFIDRRKVVEVYKYRDTKVIIVQNPVPHEETLSICFGRYPKDDDSGLWGGTLEDTRELANELIDEKRAKQVTWV